MPSHSSSMWSSSCDTDLGTLICERLWRHAKRNVVKYSSHSFCCARCGHSNSIPICSHLWLSSEHGKHNALYTPKHISRVHAELRPLTPTGIELTTGVDGLDWARAAALPTVDLLALHIFRPGALANAQGKHVDFDAATTQCQPAYSVISPPLPSPTCGEVMHQYARMPTCMHGTLGAGEQSRRMHASIHSRISCRPASHLDVAVSLLHCCLW